MIKDAGGSRTHFDRVAAGYGGSLFNPDRFPFLEGRPERRDAQGKKINDWQKEEANPLPVNNRTVLHLLEALQLLQVKMPGGGPAEARRLSFRALDIEQIGHVYEGLLDHTAKRATEPFLGLTGTRNKEPEIPVSELEKLLEKGEADLLKFLKGETGRSPKALKKSLNAEIDGQDAARLRTACQTKELWKRVEPFAGLIRNDTFGYPWVVPKGSVFVTAGTDRRSSGTHYTPRSLTEPIVQYTLEPLVYVGPAEGKPKSEWNLKSAAELLDLKICDMACGSGAFLVQSARYMSERLLEAWETAKEANPDVPGITPEGERSTGEPSESLVPVDPDERRTYAMRIIAQRCLYGVDVNPLAAEMAKLSLWLLTLAKDKPFEFFDHAIRYGDSLVGLHDLKQLRHYSLKPDADDAVLFKGPLDESVDEAINLRLKLEDMPANTVEDVEAQEKLLAEAEDKIARLRCAADLLVAAEFWGENAKDKQEKERHFANVSGHYVDKGPTEEFEEKADKERRGQKMFHWPGHATVTIAQLWLRKGEWRSDFVLDGQSVAGITPFLVVPGTITGKPFRLEENQSKSFQGSIVLGMGFVLQPDEAMQLIDRNPDNKDVLFQYIVGSDLNSTPSQSARRWVINFFDWPLDRNSAPTGYQGPVATDYPDCLSVIEQKVKPERTRKKPNGEYALRKPLPQRWWIYADKRPELYETIRSLSRVLAISLINNHLGFAFLRPDWVFAHKLAVFPLDHVSQFAVLQSNFHYVWSWEFSSTNLSLLNYSPTDCFLTFPWPQPRPWLPRN